MSWVDGRPWDKERAEEIIEVLVATYQTPAQINALIDSANINPRVIALDGELGLRWLAMVRSIHSAGSLRALLAEMVKQKPALKADVDRWMAEPKAIAGNPADVFDARLIGRYRRPLIGRRELRRNLKDFLDHELPVFVIRGEHRTGKSYSRDLVGHVLTKYPAVQLRDVDFSEVITGTGAVDLMAKLCRRLGIADVSDRDNHTTPERFAVELVDAFVGQYNATARERTVFFIDGLNRTDLEPDVYVLVAQLATEVLRSQLQRMQLILTGFGGKLGREFDDDPCLEIAQLPSESDVREYFTGLALDPPLTKTKLDAIVEKTWNAEADIEALSDTVRDSALELLDAQTGGT